MKQILPLILFGAYFHLHATTIHVPADFSSIQSAINASSNGDTIAVSPGIYYENINFRGKKILLSSLYYLSADTLYISSTIINGSTPVNADTASCVIFNSGEDSTAILQGFTITGGTGTKWLDIHGAGTFREGGGILIELCSPTVRCNIIKDNFAINTSGVSGAGGGGIRIGDGNPLIENNFILSNEGQYGAGIVLNYTGCMIRNNVIASNSGGQTFFGGSGIWITSNLSTTPKIIMNNTIVNNFSSLAAGAGTGGILSWGASNVIIKNNIIWGNLPPAQIKVISSAPAVTYSDVQSGYTGTGNFILDPLFNANCFLLASNSPCIDHGDTAAAYNDVAVSTIAVFPSMGTEQNDVGAYGGPYALIHGCIETVLNANEVTHESPYIKVFPNHSSGQFTVYNLQTGSELLMFDVLGNKIFLGIANGMEKKIDLSDFSSGIYFLAIIHQGKIIKTKKLIKDGMEK